MMEERRAMSSMTRVPFRKCAASCAILCLLASGAPCLGVETGVYRLLSISVSEKIILVSHVPSKKKYLLDTASAKIMIHGKAAELADLKSFSVLQVKMELRKIKRNEIDIDGVATEIRVAAPEGSR
jgi:hypothetical protein